MALDPASDPAAAQVFRYEGYDLDPAAGRLTCRYALDDLRFEERVTFSTPVPAGAAERPAVDAAARLVFLLAGISYYKAAAPPVIAVGDPGLTPEERGLLRAFYQDGLGEYAYRNGLDLSGVRIEAADRPAAPVAYEPAPGQPLIPFGGGIDSIVTVEGVRPRADDPALFVVSRAGDRFDAIEGAAAVTGLPVVRAERELDPQILRSRELGFRNGHIPVTGILSAIAVMAAVLEGRDAVVMSNEWSASLGNVEVDGRSINHQWSKSLDFEDRFRAVLGATFRPPPEYFSWLRPFSELWVARAFADLPRYHRVVRSCNRAFHIDRRRRLDHWCGECDKCCFIDLILAPYVPADELAAVFGGREPLADPARTEQFRTLIGASPDTKPWECVGDIDECRVAAQAAAARPDRAGVPLLAALAAEAAEAAGDLAKRADEMLRPLGSHRTPSRYAPVDLLG